MTWTDKAQEVFNTTHDALQAVYDELNKGQRQKLLKNEKIKALLEHYGVGEEVVENT